MTPDGRKRMTVAAVEARLLHAQDWHQLSMGEGTKGPRWFDWACLPMLHHCEDDTHHWLRVGRNLTDPTDKAYYARLWTNGDHAARHGRGDCCPLAHRGGCEKQPRIWDSISMKYVVGSDGIDM